MPSAEMLGAGIERGIPSSSETWGAREHAESRLVRCATLVPIASVSSRHGAGLFQCGRVSRHVGQDDRHVAEQPS